jgi:hypothetical protein
MNKKLYTALFVLITALIAYLGYDKFIKVKVKPVVVIDECNPANYSKDKSAKHFVVSGSSTPLVRKNFNNLTDPEQQNIEYAIGQMKAISLSDPLYTNPSGYDFQARIHNGPKYLGDLTIPFKTCQHDDCCFFLAWHRMYIYFFERILRSKMDPSKPMPALPFWDFQDFNIPAVSPTPLITGSIPWRFRYPATTTNALYDANRNPDFNKYPDGIAFYPSISTIAFNNAMNITGSSTTYNYNYFDFQNAIYNAHGTIHSTIGKWSITSGGITATHCGDLADLETAAKDPLFFLLHANVDRMWEMWLNLKPKNMNPSASCNAYWRNRQFVFYDESGAKVYLKGSDIINTAPSTLNYSYDGVSVPAIKKRTCTVLKFQKKCPTFPKATGYTEAVSLMLKERVTNLSNAFSVSSALKNLIATNPTAGFNFSDSSDGDNVFIEIEDIKPTLEPNGAVEIYVSMGDIVPQELLPQSPAFAGIINLLDVKNSMGVMHKKIQRININELIIKQRLNYASLPKLKLVFLARGNYLQNVEIPTTVALTIGKFRIATYKTNELFEDN